MPPVAGLKQASMAGTFPAFLHSHRLLLQGPWRCANHVPLAPSPRAAQRLGKGLSQAGLVRKAAVSAPAVAQPAASWEGLAVRENQSQAGSWAGCSLSTSAALPVRPWAEAGLCPAWCVSQPAGLGPSGLGCLSSLEAASRPAFTGFRWGLSPPPAGLASGLPT